MSKTDNLLILKCHPPVDMKKPPFERVAYSLNALTLNYLQFLQVQLAPQLQLSQVQFELSHFNWNARVMLLN